MARSLPRSFGWALALALTLGSWSPAAHAGEHRLRYRYISFEDAEIPPGFSGFGLGLVFVPGFPGALNGSDQVAGAVSDDSGEPHVAVYEHGIVEGPPARPPVERERDQRGRHGRWLCAEPCDRQSTGGALLRRSRAVHPHATRGDLQLRRRAERRGHCADGLVHRLQRHAHRDARGLREGSGDAALFRRGHHASVGGYTSIYLYDRGEIAGTTGVNIVDDALGFRFDPRTHDTTLLYPIDGDPLAWAQGINQSGDVLGYSFVNNGQERIGVWDRQGKFEVYFTEGNAQFPTISNHVLFNEQDLIVITWNSDNTSYLVPEPGVRLDLADLTDNLPSWATPLD